MARRPAARSIAPTIVRILSVEEVGTVLGISRATVHRWARDGVLPPKRQIGPGRVGFKADEIATFIDSRPPALGVAVASSSDAGVMVEK